MPYKVNTPAYQPVLKIWYSSVTYDNDQRRHKHANKLNMNNIFDFTFKIWSTTVIRIMRTHVPRQ